MPPIRDGKQSLAALELLRVIASLTIVLFHGFWQNVGFILIGTLITIAAAKVLYELIERPLSELQRERAKQMTTILAPHPDITLFRS